MSSQARSFSTLALALSSGTVLGTLTLVYGLVYPSGACGSKAPLAWALIGGIACGLLAMALGVAAHRRATKDSERFFALLTLVLGGYFLLVMALGFGIPSVVLSLHD